jgi:hypothetical protein
MLTDHYIAQLMNQHSLQDGNNDSPWWLTFARAVEARAGADANHALEDECKRTDSLLTILGLPAERCRSAGGSLIPRKVMTLMGEARAAACWPHFDEWWNSPAADPLRAAYPDADGRDFECIWIAASARNQDDTADAVRFRWLCEHPDWHFVERLCREFVADSNMEFLAELRRVIDARRSMELGPFEEHMPPDDMAYEREADRITRAALGADVTRPINPNARSIDDL